MLKSFKLNIFIIIILKNPRIPFNLFNSFPHFSNYFPLISTQVQAISAQINPRFVTVSTIHHLLPRFNRKFIPLHSNPVNELQKPNQISTDRPFAISNHGIITLKYKTHINKYTETNAIIE
ncbi:hypothetical protein PanWU01x14_294730 [Parasponia andersonii]|uniref:Uncharacterized protein n=1 Tax=Parasponia andersonii TaxID=3476 RepID=A0A2P5AW47_PARAD|nr:hypothetical protein PanWU01x14_294730 [Parasponia andersonii]